MNGAHCSVAHIYISVKLIATLSFLFWKKENTLHLQNKVPILLIDRLVMHVCAGLPLSEFVNILEKAGVS